MWTLQTSNQTFTFEQAKLNHLERKLMSQSADTVTFRQAHLFEPTSTFETGSLVTLYKDAQPWFSGIITHAPISQNATQSYTEYTLKGPWWYLENLVFQQIWLQADEPNSESPSLIPIHKGRLILGQDAQGQPLTVASQVREILSYCIQSGAHFQIGTLDLDFTIPFDEVKDISCAEALQRLLRWAPDAVSFFDYTTVPPTLHIRRRSTMPSIYLDLSVPHNITQLHITPRHDLQVPSVVLKYEQIHKAGHQSWSTTAVDAYPHGANGQEFKSMVLTIDMAGSHSTYIRQRVVTQPIDPHNPAWWQQHLPSLAALPTSAITLKNVTRQTDLPYELTGGAIASWMHVEAAEETIRAKIDYTAPDMTVIDQDIAVRLISTNAATKTYKKLNTTLTPELIPQGLAQHLYHALSPLTFEGTLTLQKATISPSLGFTLNLNYTDPAWSTMHALIQSVRENVDNQTLTVCFGPPKHLGASDLVELLRMNRRRFFSRNASSRAVGHPAHLSPIEQSLHTPIQNTTLSSGHFQKLTFKHPTSPNTAVTVETAYLPDNLQIELRPEYVCENGELKQRFALCSQPISLA